MSGNKLRAVYWTIWVNMFLWMAAFGFVMQQRSPEQAEYAKYMVGGGFLFSALLQHWAYYNLRKSVEAGKSH